ncbi:MAG: hypothetical protein WBD20_14555, partial [Pirellulaceae bacterium]
NAGMTYDQVNVMGTVNLAGVLDLSLIDNVTATNVYTIINNDGADAVTGEFSNYADGAIVAIGPASFVIDYQGGDGNDVTLTAQSTSTASFWDGGAATLSWSDAANWSGDTIPAFGADVFINAAAGEIISADAATILVATLTSTNSIDVDSGTFITTGTVDITGDLRIGSATISGGTWNVSGDVSLTAATTVAQANIDGLTLNKDIPIDTNQRLRLLASPTLGNLNFVGDNSYLTMNPGDTINANINVTSGGNTFFNMNGAGNLTLPVGQSITVSSGELHLNGTGGFTSDGSITASDSGRILFINTATINGSIAAEQTLVSSIEFSVLPTNVSGGTLTGGNWITRNKGRFIFPAGGAVNTISADVGLQSPIAVAESLGFESPQDTDAFAALGTINANSSLTIGPAHSRTTSVALAIAGKLHVDGTFTGTNIFVAADGTLSGSGTANAPVTAQSFGTISPGDPNASSVGTLTVERLELQNFATLNIELGGAGGPGNAGVTYDQVDVNGTVHLFGSLETFLIANVPTIGEQYTIIDNDGAEAVSGTFDGLAEGATISAGPASFTISYVGGDGNDVTLTALSSTTAVFWDGGGGDSTWNNNANWSGDVFPTISDDVVISDGSTGLITVGAFSEARSLFSDRPLRIQSQFTLGTTATINESVSLRSNLIGGTWTATGGFNADTSGIKELRGAHLIGNLNIGSLATVELYGGSNATTYSLTGDSARLSIEGGNAIGGDVTVSGSGAGTTINAIAGTGVITLDAGKTIEVTGTRNVTISGGLTPGSFINEGTVRTTSSATRSITINNTFTNNGLVDAQGQTIQINAPTTNFSAGTLSGGIWRTAGSGRIVLHTSHSISAIEADIQLNSPNVPGTSLGIERDLGTNTDTLADLTTIAAAGSLTIGPLHTRTTSSALTVDGVLTADGTLVATSVTVGSTGTLNGSGDIDAPVTVNAGATILPGNSPGILSTGDFDLQSGASLEVELGGLPANAGTDYDQLNVTGTVTLAGNLAVTPTVGLNAGEYVIIANDGADLIVGEFAGLPEGSLVSVGGKVATISYAGGDGNDVTLLASVKEWDGGGGDFLWNNPLNWSGDVLPGPADNVVIDVAGGGPISILSTGNVSIASLDSEEYIYITSGIFESSGTVDSNQFFVNGGHYIADHSLVTNAFGVPAGTLTLTPNTSISDTNFNVDSATIRTVGTGPEIVFTNTIFLVGETTFDIDNDLVIDTIVSGSGGFVKDGPAVLRLSQTNQYNGLTTINAGEIFLTGSGTLGSAGVGTIIGGGAALRLGQGMFNNDAVTLQGINPSLLTFAGAPSVQQGDVILAATDDANILASNQFSIRGQISGSVSGAGRLNVGGLSADLTMQLQPTVDNTYVATTVVADGNLQTLTSDVIAITGDVIVGNSDATRAFLSLARPNTVAPTANITLNSDAYLDLDTRNVGSAFAVNQTIHDLTVTGTALAAPVQTASQIDTTSTQHANVGTLTIAGKYTQLAGLQTTVITGRMAFEENGGAINFDVADGTANPDVQFAATSNVIDPAGVGAITTAGTGRILFDGNVDQSGAVTISDSTFELNGLALTAPVVVQNGGTLIGTGTIHSSVGVHAGGTIAPGNSPGIINTGDFQLDAGSTLELELGGTTAGTEYDQVNVTGTVTLGGNVEVTAFSAIAGGTTFIVINNDGADLVSGLINGVAQGGTLSTSVGDFTVSYTGGDGNDVTLTSIATTFFVTNTNDAGAGSLRQAITDANALVGTDYIHFNIPGVGPHTIQPLSALPTIAQSVVLDATSEPDFVGSPMVEIDGSLAGATADGFVVNAGSSTIRGFVINNFGIDGIVVNGNSNTIAGNWFGLDPDGLTAQPNVRAMRVTADANVIGGPDPSDRNVMSGQSNTAVYLTNGADNNSFEGNYFGLDWTGTVAVPNAGNALGTDNASGIQFGVAGGLPNVVAGNLLAGITLFSSSNAVIVNNFFGTDASGLNAIPNGNQAIRFSGNSSGALIGQVGAGNVIVGSSGNADPYAIHLDENITNTIIRANLIGVGVDGTTDLAGESGIQIDSTATGTVVGGSSPGQGNVIGGHSNHAIASAAANTTIQGNLIGVSADGNVQLANGSGIYLTATSALTIGGSAGGENTIAFNTTGGIVTTGAVNHVIAENLIYGNGGLDIDVGNNGSDAAFVTLDPVGDGLSGISGTIDVPSSTAYDVYLFAGSSQDSERTFVRKISATAPITAGPHVFADATPLDPTKFYSAYASGAACGSSEFTPAFSRFIVTNTNDSGPGSLRQAITDANSVAGTDYIAFDIPGAGPHTIQPLSALPTISQSVVLDATTEPDFAGSPVVEIDGTNAGASSVEGLTLTGGGTTIRGLVINRFTGDGIHAGSGAGYVIEGNYIGTDVTGLNPAHNNSNSIIFAGAGASTIGGSSPEQRNILRQIFSWGGSGHRIQGNYIGIGSDGQTSIGDGVNHGVRFHQTVSNSFIGTDGDGINDATEGNVIGGQGRGIFIDDSNSNITIAGNLIGLDATGTIAVPNSIAGIQLDGGANNNTIGTDGDGISDDLERNIISGNAVGIHVHQASTSSNVIAGNYIGTNLSGTAAVPNMTYGIHIEDSATGNTIGGTSSAMRNVISGNVDDGILVEANNTTILDNYIGTDVTGLRRLGNSGEGIRVAEATGVQIGAVGSGNVIVGYTADGTDGGNGVSFGTNAGGTVIGNLIGVGSDGVTLLGLRSNGVGNSALAGNIQIGGSDPGEGNVIGGARVAGIVSSQTNALTTRTIEGNFIGVAADGLTAIPNRIGVRLVGSAASFGITLGGAAGAENTIAYNSEDGVEVSLDVDHVVAQNFIFGNGELGIDVSRDGLDVPSQVTIDSIDFATGVVNVSLTDLPASTGMTVYLYSGDRYGDAQELVGSSAVSTDATGNGSIGIPATIVGDKYLTAYASDTAFGSTEFSRSVKTTIQVTNSADSGPGSLRQAILDANAQPNADVIEFFNTGTGWHTIVLSSPLPAITQPLTLDGYADPDASPNSLTIGNNASIVWVIDGVTSDVFTVNSSDVTIRGLSIVGADDAILIGSGAQNVKVAGNFLGLLPDGVTTVPNANAGVRITGGANSNTVGGDSAADRNAIAGGATTAGIWLEGVSDNFVKNNYIGTTADGTAAAMNSPTYGVYLTGTAQRNEIAGSLQTSGNVISGNNEYGIRGIGD